MSGIASRRLLAALVTAAVAAVGALVAGAAPAHAAPTGYLLLKGTGSVYTSNGIVNLGVTPGSSKTWGLKVVNTGSTAQQFKITITSNSPLLTTTLLAGSAAVQAPYYTAPIAPGRSVSLSLKMLVAAGAPAAEYVGSIGLRDPETNTFLDSGSADANATYQTGNTRHDLFVKTGSQPFVGGSVGQFETATALKPGNTASFTVRLRNDGGSPTAIGVSGGTFFDCPADWSIVIKQGTKDVTAAVRGATYSTGVLAPGAKVELKASIKLLHATTCTAAYVGFTGSAADGTVTSYAHVVTGV